MKNRNVPVSFRPHYDPLGNRLTSLTDLNAQPITFAYDALSRRTSVTLPNGVASASVYDAANRLTSLTTTKGATPLSSVTYGYDSIGNRTSTTDSAGSHAYTYDPLSQLTQATTPAVSFAYDPVGNRTTAAGQSYVTNSLNQYTTVGGIAQTSDLDGNLTTDGSATYTYDAENRLSQIVKGSTTVTVTYDPFGRRASKTVNGVTTKFLYDGADLLAETDAAGTLTARYLIGPRIDEPLELTRGTTTHYYTADGLGSIAHLTTASGTIAESYTYDPFGAPTIRNTAGTIIPASALGNPFLFTGREWDSETALYFYRARYYKPAIGRFLSRDPLGYAPDANRYRYVGNNPVNWIDPSGTTLIGSGPGSVAIIDIWPHQEPGIIADPTPEPPGSGILDGPQPGGGIIEPGLIIDRGPDPEPDAGILDGPSCGGQCSGPLQGMDQPGVEKAEPAPNPGPSGKPRIHKRRHPTRKRAKEAAEREGPGKPIQHPNPRRGRPHFHPTDETGEKIPGGTHHEYPWIQPVSATPAALKTSAGV